MIEIRGSYRELNKLAKKAKGKEPLASAIYLAVDGVDSEYPYDGADKFREEYALRKEERNRLIADLLEEANENGAEFFTHGRTCVCLLPENDLLGVGKAVAAPDDKFDIDAGCALSFLRAEMELHKKNPLHCLVTGMDVVALRRYL